jgi:hypothetical protein
MSDVGATGSKSQDAYGKINKTGSAKAPAVKGEAVETEGTSVAKVGAAEAVANTKEGHAEEREGHSKLRIIDGATVSPQGRIDSGKFKDFFSDNQVEHANKLVDKMSDLPKEERGALIKLHSEFAETINDMDDSQLIDVAKHINGLMSNSRGDSEVLGALMTEVLNKLEHHGKPAPFPWPDVPTPLPGKPHPIPWFDKNPGIELLPYFPDKNPPKIELLPYFPDKAQPKIILVDKKIDKDIF